MNTTSIDLTNNPYREDFPLLVANPEVSFLDSAATSQSPAVVIDAQKYFYEQFNANPLRGLYRFSVEATRAIEETRSRIARLIGAVNDTGAPQTSSIIFTRNTTESLNLIAHSFAPLVLEKDDEVVISIMEHHSNLIVWQEACKRAGAKLVYLYPDLEGHISDEEIEAKIGPKCKIVAVAHVSNVMGVELPVRAISQRAHAQGAVVVLDAAQSLPHLPLNVYDLGVDFLAASAHKAFGPLGVGILWGKPELLAAMPPMLTGGEMIASVREQDATWAQAPERFEAGTQDAAGIYATGIALTYLAETIGYEKIAQREHALMQEMATRLAELPFVSVIGPKDPALRHGVASFCVDGIHPHDVASILDMHNVCIRAGHHCAEPLLRWLQVEHLASCRASLAFYNTQADIDALIDGLNAVWKVFHGRS